MEDIQGLAKLNKQLSKLKGIGKNKKAILKGGFVLERYSKENAPVLTGALRASGHTVESEDGAEVIFDVNYAWIREVGNEKTPANGYVRRAIDEHSEDIVKAVAEQLDKDIKKEVGG